ncbi:uncharacterized protein LOC133200011 [Saccostrea echinata]|uniref:uncharacterized protein LOC133200011 n=1 Tax=Saccostrea echinata TaxID=191078 RepID=UPI002A8133F4|nr:uncharacterized protein LOC133200011 [Saccostrea echinata]
MKNNPSFNYEKTEKMPVQQRQRTIRHNSAIPEVRTRKTETTPVSKHSENDNIVRCPYHHTRHSLNECTKFRSKTMEERKKFIIANGICLKCCGPDKHYAKNCATLIKCGLCSQSSHPTALHIDSPSRRDSREKENHGGEQSREAVTISCTKICGTVKGTSKSCAKILPVKIYLKDSVNQCRIVYAMLDDQSNHSLAAPSLLDAFNVDGPEYEYTLTSCSGSVMSAGRRAQGLVVESIDGSCSFDLPTLIECSDLPNNREEIPSPRIAEQFSHLADIKDSIPELIESAEIELLIGRDLISAHVVEDQRHVTGNPVPYAQKLPLGWVIIGPVCLDAVHMPDKVTVHKTYVLSNGRPSVFQPCDNKLLVKDDDFLKTDHDEKIAPSIEDTTFLDIIDKEFQRNPDGYWEAPLPFRTQRQLLPNNKPQAINRALSLDRSLKRNLIKREHVSKFMDKIFEKGHAEEAPPIPDTKVRWYLPMFGVYHPQKRDSIRMVFDSSAKFNNISLNDVLLKSPDITNNLQGILLRFRREKVAVIGDVEQMFHNFKVKLDHGDYLRFLWHPENNLDLPLKEYRMTVHVFLNRPSPAFATYGLRRCVAYSDPDVIDFISKDFYVDDGLLSCPSEDMAIELMKRTQLALKEGGQLKLHKISSNSKSVLLKFPADDLAKDLEGFRYWWR